MIKLKIFGYIVIAIFISIMQTILTLRSGNKIMKQEDQAQFVIEGLKYHNQYRKKYHAQPLKFDLDLFKQAKKYARKLADSKELKQSMKNGENLEQYCGNQQPVPAKKIIKVWYDERRDFDFSDKLSEDAQQANNLSAKHFTQIIWKSTKKMGMAYATNGLCTYVVARYDPPGNEDGKFNQNLEKEI